jgi:uncharacterized membrane protein
MTDLQDNFLPLPQPEEISIREKEDAMGAYFMMFATLAVGLPFPLLNIIAAVIYLLLNKDKSRYVFFHSLQSLYSQIPVSVLNGILVIWLVISLIPHPDFTREFISFAIMCGAVNIVYITFSIIAAVKARRGIFYYFVFFGKIAYRQAYSKKTKEKVMPVNMPPQM